MHHHFSDDEEEEDDNEAMIDVQELNILNDDINAQAISQINPASSDAIVPNNEPSKPSHLQVIGPDGEDFTQYFDKNFVAVERVLYTTVIFPVIHPRQAR